MFPMRGAVWNSGMARRADGRRWAVAARDTANLYGVWGRPASDVWAVGEFGVILHGAPQP